MGTGVPQKEQCHAFQPVEMFQSEYADVYTGDEQWRALPTPEGDTFTWADESTYVQPRWVAPRKGRPFESIS